MRKTRKHNKRSLQFLHKKARKIFAKWIVARDKGICFTCGRPGNQAGHFRHGHNMDFSEEGNHCQCPACNFFRNGNLIVYAVNLERKYGFGIIQKLKREGDKVRTFKRQEYLDIIKKYSVV